MRGSGREKEKEEKERASFKELCVTKCTAARSDRPSIWGFKRLVVLRVVLAMHMQQKLHIPGVPEIGR